MKGLDKLAHAMGAVRSAVSAPFDELDKLNRALADAFADALDTQVPAPRPYDPGWHGVGCVVMPVVLTLHQWKCRELAMSPAMTHPVCST